MKTIRIVLLLLIQATAIITFSQQPAMRFEHFETEQGLSQSNVTCILQDSRGLMWFGTRDGLNKYDGYKFTVYKNEASNRYSVSNNFIKGIVEDSKGDLWIATWGGGLNRYDRSKDRFVTYRHDPKDPKTVSTDFTTCVFIDSKGMIWVGTEGGISVLNASSNQFIHYSTDAKNAKSVSDNYVRCIFEDSQQQIWVGTFKGGLNKFDRKQQAFTHYVYEEKNNNSISGNNVYTIFEDSKHFLWVGTDGTGLNKMDKATGIFTRYIHDNKKANSLAANSVYAIGEDNQHLLWVGTENGGLNILDPETGMFYTYQNDEGDKNSLGNNSIHSIHKDAKGNMWLGTFNAGVDMVSADGNKFAHYKHSLSKNSLSNNNVLCIFEDSKQNIWIGTDGGGLNLFNPVTHQFTYFKHQDNNRNSICGNYVLSVYEDSKGNIWIGTWAGGITVYNPAKQAYTHFKHDPSNSSSLSSNNAWKIFEDHEKNIWVGTYGGGLNLYNPSNNSFTRYQYQQDKTTGISSDNIYSIFEDRQGKLWVSTDGGGLCLFDRKTKTFSRYVHEQNKNSIASNTVTNIFEDGKGNLWIGTMAGLSFLDRKNNHFTNYTTTDGLPNNVVYGILEDKSGNLWLSTNKGIAKFDPATKKFKNFNVSDGLQSNEFKQQAYCLSHTGAMYFGGNNGFNEFYPEKMKENSFEPKLIITGFQVFNKEVPIADENNDNSPLKANITEVKKITIPHNSSVISFEFASLNYIASDKKQYAYMLEGFDTKWNDIGIRHTATYTNLDPGKYVFSVRGLNNDGTWSKNITSVELIIMPPFWMTWWFRTLVALFIVGCLVAFYRVRVKAITKQKLRLERLVKERTEETVRQKEKLAYNLEELKKAQQLMGQQVKELDELKQDLEKEKYYLDSLMDNMPDAIYFKDKESRLMRVSKYMANHFNANMEDLIGKTDFDFQDEVHAKQAYEDEQEIQRTGKPKIDYIEKEMRIDGNECWLSTTKMPLVNAKGEIVGTFGMSRDITNVKKLEEQQHAADLDKAVAQGKFEIASGVMHDIGNAVVGFGSYLTRIRRVQEQEKLENLQNLAGFFEQNKAAVAGAIGDAKAGAVIKMLCSIALAQRSNQEEIGKCVTEQFHIITHIQEILNIQRQYIKGHESKERQPVNLRSVINDSISMVFASIDKAAIAVSIDVAPDLPIIKGDRTKLMQAVLNVLKNSIESIDKNGYEKSILLRANADGDKIVMHIKDSGTGFDKSTGEKLFARGFTTKTSGSGLGLYNCRSIIESHEGSIDITSEGVGKGALTTIHFKISA
jgi:PAS domain S-box-containing protein